mgnify:CR=1 FL=1
MYYKWAECNLRLNDVENAAVHAYGLWIGEDELSVAQVATATGLTLGELKIRVKPLVEALRNIDVMKMDCEGCEWTLLTTPCDYLRSVTEYVVEIRGPKLPIIRKMEKCGFKPQLIRRLHPLLTVWHFSL